MPKCPAVLFLLVLLFPFGSVAQIDTSASLPPGSELTAWETLAKDGSSLLGAAGFIATAPLRWEKTDWATLGGVAVLTGAAALLDDETFGLMNRNRNSLNDRLEKLTVWYGIDVNIILFAGGFYTAGLLAPNRWMRETGFLVGTSMILSGAVSGVVKAVTGRARPYLGLGNHDFHPFTLWDNDFHALPSGHTIVAFSASTVLARRIGNPWATAGLYTLATGTALSRTYSRNHWFSDIVMGGLLSTFISDSIVRWYERGETTSANVGLNVVPWPGGVTVVISL